MTSFAERMGFRAKRSLVQHASLDEETRNDLRNVIVLTRQTADENDYQQETTRLVTTAIWAWEFKRARDEEPAPSDVWGMVKEVVLRGKWFDAIDLLEAFVGYVRRFKTRGNWELDQAVISLLNSILEKNMVGFRLIDKQFVPLDTSEEAEALTHALEIAADFAGARHHLGRAAELLSDRKSPDYPNSIKESISAVEAVVAKVTGQQTLGTGLKRLKDSGLTIHPALEQAWAKMYGWTSDAEGIRHAAVGEADSDQNIAKYMVVACAAFVSYLIEAARKTELI